MSTSGVTEYTKTIQRTWTRKRLHISIDLAGEQGNIINTYTTSDRIDGTAAIAADEDVDFDVTFEGIYRVYNERTGPPHTDRRVGASKTFLKLRHPLSTNAYPTSRRFQKGEKFIFPFSFVVPDHMDAPFCMFNSDETHIQLPPTLKGGKLTGADGSLSDDFTPTVCEVVYAIQVRVVQTTTNRTLKTQSQHVRLIPPTPST
ncbi:uncharacterized protein BO97DRAFT_118177 [Aspergillus homomorphus CBS 101889]|uniref:Arrestin-like N-terminal domain-containing protein n=1 Tax=Aspergillus homomorphus (strain CBS 101889) TaxID=1450537 RepID=A0A395HS20_ASPHC|nr:hypothetical protein BO97DRAFT_118177 [Aspergillus homomorphus CBS 101889]RAL10732.1 hypothetical protein BO97DRAFT_118177 [Aspergillus homomorphus CBS 101889]